MGIENGAVPVARIDGLPGDEARIVVGLRLRTAGPEARVLLRDDLASDLGDGAAKLWVERLDDLMHLIEGTARRPILTHGLSCDCVGADEAVLAHLISTAARGDREDAMLVACLLVRADAAPLVVSLAQTLGLMLARHAPSQVLH